MTLPPLVISHRTHAGTMPENTLAGVDAALAAGVDGVELDVRATSDGVVVLLHDETLQRTGGDPRAVSDLAFEELRQIALPPGDDLAQPAPALASVFQRVGGRAIVVVEVKQAGIHELVTAEVRAAGAEEWTWIWSFDPMVLAACRRTMPEVPATLLTAPGSLARFGIEDDPLALAVREGLAGVSWHHASVDRAATERARRRGLAVCCWTPNEPADIGRVIEAGVDAVCSDFPERVRAALGA